MIESTLKSLLNFDSRDVEGLVDKITDSFPDVDLSDQAQKAIALVTASGITADAIKSAGSRAASSTTQYVMDNPRRTGAGLGAVIAVGIGAYFLIRTLKTRDEMLPDDDTLLLPAPEEA